MANKIQKSQTFHHGIIQKQLQIKKKIKKWNTWERYIFPEKREKRVNDLRLISYYNNKISKK